MHTVIDESRFWEIISKLKELGAQGILVRSRREDDSLSRTGRYFHIKKRRTANECDKISAKEEWDELLKRPVMNVDTLRETVCRVLDDVKTGGDRTVMAYEKQFDHVELERLAVTEEEMDEAERLVSPELKDALRLRTTI